MAASPQISVKLALDLRKQLKSEWCWAAVTQSVDHLFRPSSELTQCRIVSRNFKKDCCAEPGGPPLDPGCNRPWFLHRALDNLGLLKGDFRDGPVTFAQLRDEIDAGRPVCVLISWKRSGFGHFIIIHGYGVSAQGNEIVFLQDPLEPAPTWMFYDRMASKGPGEGYQDGQGVWSGSVLVKKPT
jgi:hypothetical protein